MTELSREYGEGLYTLAVEENQQAEWLEQLAQLRDCFHANRDFVRLLSNLSLSKEERVTILDNSLRGQVHPYVLNFLKLVCERGAFYEIDGCIEAYRALYNQDHRVVEAVVTTCRPLTGAQREQLLRRLREMSGKQVTLVEKQDASVMGGVVLEMDGKRYDNSVASRLESVRRVIAGQGV